MTICPECGEASEDQFDSCWRCGSALGPQITPPPEQEAPLPEKLPVVKTDGRCWLYSLLFPVGFMGLGILIARLVPMVEGDWIGARVMLPLLLATIVAAVSALGFAFRSIVRSERHAIVAFISGGIAFVYLACVIISVAMATL